MELQTLVEFVLETRLKADAQVDINGKPCLARAYPILSSVRIDIIPLHQDYSENEGVLSAER